ncbi:MAG: hypothetical protein FWF59_11655 [Turicibacter sp.]|nr:hypothetical protein [Turicibacter sp.]
MWEIIIILAVGKVESQTKYDYQKFQLLNILLGVLLSILRNGFYEVYLFKGLAYGLALNGVTCYYQLKGESGNENPSHH